MNTSRTPFLLRALALVGALSALAAPARALDSNGNGLNDVWEIIFNASALTASGDADGDGATNQEESLAGTNPFDSNSRPALSLAPWSAAQFQLGYARSAGKRYRIEFKTDLAAPSWTPLFTEVALDSAAAAWLFSNPAGNRFYRLAIGDVDSDGDGLLDAEERWLGFDPTTNRSDRNDSTDAARVTAGLSAASVVTVGVLDARMSERWPDPAVVVVRRSGGLKPITVNVGFTGTATRNADYSASIAGNVVFIPAGVREVPIVLTPIADADDAEAAETIIVTVLSGSGYSLGTGISGTLTLDNETAASLPSAKAAARFLLQAAFGPDQDANSNGLPENVEQLMSVGFSAWIDDQFTQPIGYVQPWVDWARVNAQGIQLYGNWKEFSWWARAMGAP
ncbi:MAG: thrombospondin type 3 repeat-containing protein, partial [Chthoniobacteraceae bacterium]